MTVSVGAIAQEAKKPAANPSRQKAKEQAKAKASAPKKELTPAEKRNKPRKEVSPDIDFAPKHLALAGKAGTTVQGIILVKNKTANAHTVEFFMEDLHISEFGAVSKQNNSLKVPNVKKEDLVVSEPSFSIQPNETKKITINVKIPKDAKDEMYFKYTFRPTKESRRQQATGNSRLKSAGLSFYANLFVVGKVKVLGQEKYEMEYVSTDASYDKKSQQLRISTIIKNLSNVHLTNMSGVAVVLKDGKTLARVQYGSIDSSPTFMPKAKKRYQGVVSANLPKGSYEIVETFSDPEGKLIKVNRKPLEVK